MTQKIIPQERHFGPIWFIPGENAGRYPFCHSIYIEGPGILIDPASDRKRLMEIREHPGVQQVWLSHSHEDHFMHLDLFDDIPLYISMPDARPLSDLDLFMDAYGIDLEVRPQWRPFFEDQFRFKPRIPAGFLNAGDVMDLGPVRVRIIAAPGHTPGHLALFFEDQEVLFLGDYDLTRFGPWYGDVLSSIEETIASVQRLRQIPAKVWLTCHETGVFEEEPGELWDQYLSVIALREEKLVSFLQSPRSLEEIVNSWIVYGKAKEPKIFFDLGERGTMKKHLERLLRQGRVIQENGRYHAP